MRQVMEQKKSSDQGPDLGGPVPSARGDSFLRRNNRGCKSKDFYNWPEQPFEEMDSPLAVQQYIQQLIYRNPADIDEILRLPEGQDLGAWKIEHLRLFCMQLNRLAAKLQDCCYPETCNQMTATEQWIFLCAAHKQPNECPAIDYTRHTLDGAASLLNSNKYFPSRVTIKDSSVAKLGSVCRRVYRIFSHAYYHHFQIFDDFERETHLCKRFSKFVTMYELMPKESLIVPADGSKPEIDIEKPSIASSDTTVLDGGTNDASSQPPTTAIGGDSVSSKPEDPKTETEDNEQGVKVKMEAVAMKASSPLTKTPAVVATAVVTPKVENKSQKDETSPPTVASKKPNASPMTTSPPKSTTWTPSPMSTNTMVKSSINPRSANLSDTKKTVTDSESKTTGKPVTAQAGNPSEHSSS